MANWTILKEAIASVIKTNDNQEITGQLLQNALNNIITNVGENATFAGIATPTTNPGTPDGPVFYIATIAGSYSNFGSLEVSKGETAILQWNNGTWTKNDIKPMAEFESGIIYDVSANNDGAVFESLSTLLGSANLSTLIPTSVRRGGMSILFIQGSVPNSDNKYVQYRLMSDTFNTTVANWQGVDDEPTVGSENILESEGAFEAIGTGFIDKNVLATNSATTIANIHVENAPIEFILEVLENTAEYTEPNNWIGIQVNNKYRSLSINNNYLHYKETSSQLLNATDFSIYVRKVSVAGHLRIKMTINYGKGFIKEQLVSLTSQVEEDSGLIKVVKVSSDTFATANVNKIVTLKSINNNYLPLTDYMLMDGDIVKLTINSKQKQTVNIAEATAKNGSARIEPFILTSYELEVGTYNVYFKKHNTSNYLSFHTINSNIPDCDVVIDKTSLSEVPNSQVKDICKVLPFQQEWQEESIVDSLYSLYNPTDSNGSRINSEEHGTVQKSSITTARITRLIRIDRTKKYKIRTAVGRYFDGVAYYTDNALSLYDNYIGNDVFHASNDAIVENELTIPDNAVFMRFATKNEATFNVYTKPLANVASETQMQAANSNIGLLFDIIDTAGAFDLEKTVRYQKEKTLYLGTNILDISNVSYDSSKWTVDNGNIVYLGNGSPFTPFVFNINTVSGERYLCEIVVTAPNGLTDLFSVQIGDNPDNDPYNGTTLMYCGFLSDGGAFKVLPKYKEFTITSISLKKVFGNIEEQGVQESKVIQVLNVTNGNSAGTMISGKWNVAIGPIENTFSNNIDASRNIAIGYSALERFSYGMQNVGIGTFALRSLVIGKGNVAIGSDSFYNCKEAYDNVAIGRMALEGGIIPDGNIINNNVAIGRSSMGIAHKNTNNSIAIGYASNYYGCPNSVFIGHNTRTASASGKDFTNVIAIGYEVAPTKSNQCIIGNSSVEEFVLGNKKIIFNQDNSVTWETVS